MSKKSIVIILMALFLTSLTSYFFWAKHHIYEKDRQLYAEAVNNLKALFNGHDRIIIVEYYGEKVKSQQVPLRKLKDDVKKKFGQLVDESASLSKKEYLWNEAYGDIYKRYELIPRYKNDYLYSGYLFRVFECGSRSMSEYTLYPRFVGLRRQSSSWEYQSMPSIQEDIEDSYVFFTSDESSHFYGDFRKDHISSNSFQSAIENEYYELWSFSSYDAMTDELKKMADKTVTADRFFGSYHDTSFYVPGSYEDNNELGYSTWFSNTYCRVYLECNPINSLTIRYKASHKIGNDPMVKDMIKLCLFGGGIISIVFIVCLILAPSALRRKQTPKD